VKWLEKKKNKPAINAKSKEIHVKVLGLIPVKCFAILVKRGSTFSL